MTKGQIGSLDVVVDPAGLDPVTGVGQGKEPAGVQAFGSDAGDEGVVRRRSRLGEVQLDTV